ncbi:lipopolysaccharide biosynthesis protein RfbH [Sphingobium fuliginis]|uniref:LPS biosynthesis protein n=1 Tax=Sphingobium fuliginis (strain ATCC 27551) TaxID=336203 RepID=A0ABQ1EM18_SPHSA|nr:lipopolysaccharide biosynthesis protein RfbH [Sphingobium fuliginis]RYM01106.1 lipopolysaccharide biosynthesis protein RfbH [Sphingobium fuliginis]GFZ77955.1 LPS biosynthesis protein [Sphingobium fuliginis]
MGVNDIPGASQLQALAEQSDEAQLRHLILDLVGEYARRHHAPQTFVPGESPVPVSGKVYGAEDMQALVDSSLDFWLTTGRFNAAFEEKLAARIGVQHALTTNSGSSANLLALSSLCSHYLRGDALKPGDEVITVATGFPTTVNPALQYGLVPVFVDVDIPTYNIKPDAIEAAVSDRTRAIMIAHTLGNPFDLGEVMRVAEKYDLWLVEDCCDALGATYGGQNVGTFGDIGTLSFYPAHHITMGEGGAVFTDKPRLKRVIESMRDWGRDCWCAPGMDNTCGKRFCRKLGDLPMGYDHKYTYSHCGYNLKITDMQAAVGLAQLDRLEGFITARRRNFDLLTQLLKPFEDAFILPEATPDSEPSWFGYPITIRQSAPFTRDELVRHLDAHRVGTRLLFGGNLIRQPYMRGRNYRVVGSLDNANFVTESTFWIGLYPGLGELHLEYVAETIEAFLRNYVNN